MHYNPAHTYFENVAALSPDAIAIHESESRITYSSLNKYSNRISHLLLGLELGDEAVIATLMPSCIELIGSLLGIFKAGGVYLPMDSGFSESRFAEIFSDTKPSVLITTSLGEQQAREVIKKSGTQQTGLLVLEAEFMMSFYPPGENSRRIFNPDDLQDKNPDLQIDENSGNYVVYTSGSTGGGKAILGCHKGLSHFIHWEIEEFGIRSDCRVSQLAQITFDASFRDIFVPLCTGGTICIPETGLKSNILKLVEWIESSGITLVHCVPSLFRLISRELSYMGAGIERMPQVKHLLMAGEALYAKDILDWRKNVGYHIELVNLYGTSETTLAKTFHRIDILPENGAQTIHVGKPISNTLVAIINGDHICKTGEIGEIYIKTPFWTKGYYGDAALTARAFVQNPLVSDRTDLVYRTGDIGRYIQDRNIEVLGRIDNQVKVNGIRVELGEIEGAVLKVPGIEEVAIIAQKNHDNDTELVCYYVGDTDPGELRKHVQQELNENIIPGYFIKMDSLPLTLNGKVDRKSLPAPESMTMESFGYEPVKTVTEERLEKIWKEVLNREQIGRKAAFFKIGGTSLKAIQVLSRVYREFDISLLIKDIFTHSTIAAMSRLVTPDALRNEYKLISQVPEASSYGLSPSQR
ncbi:AMP-binding protein, partial [Mucilaginibacter sp. RCC_168]|uniref:non-ribosomal peptide synthetase n=1 Tax=Mucilaginibacter sp. RCC_168 TaxID=3239221 RepID=UPI0035261AF6